MYNVCIFDLPQIPSCHVVNPLAPTSVWGNLKGAHLLGTLRENEGHSKNAVSLSGEPQCRGLLGRALLLGTLKDTLSKALAWVSVSIGALFLGNMEGHCFHRAFEIKR
jgi:hypothetical protein